MKRIAYICVILLCSLSFAFAQGAKPGRTNTYSKKVVKKTVVSPFAEAEKAWIPFLKRFRDALKSRDGKALYSLADEKYHLSCSPINDDDYYRSELLEADEDISRYMLEYVNLQAQSYLL